MITEIYCSFDGLEFNKMDLHKDESINMKYTQKDLQDISKIFSPFSQNFTFPATTNNRMNLGFFGDTDVIKINPDNKFACKIYTDGVLNQTGFITVSDVSYENNKPKDFTGAFATSMTSLKERIGDTLISELGDLNIRWNAKEMYEQLQGSKNASVDGVNVSYFTPLCFMNRVAIYDPLFNPAKYDNIAYRSTNPATFEGIIKPSDVRPCMSFSSIIDLIKLKYDLKITMPLASKQEYKDLFVWCNGEQMPTTQNLLLTIIKPLSGVQLFDPVNPHLIPVPFKYFFYANTTTSVFRAEIQNTDSNYSPNYTHVVELDNPIIQSGAPTTSVVIKIVRDGETDPIISKTFDIKDGEQAVFNVDIKDSFFTSGVLNYRVYADFKTSVSWSNMQHNLNAYYLFPDVASTVYYQLSDVNNNSSIVGADSINLIKSLPQTKIIDFLTSFFKAFNISVFDTSPNDENLFWLTPQDVQTSGLVYSKAVIDYTPYVDISSHQKKNASDFNYYIFKHANSKYKSNSDYKIATGVDYGQASNPFIKPQQVKEFRVETSFTIIPPVHIVGTTDVVTHYGFTSDVPTLLDDGHAKYKPNFGELTVFYNHGSISLGSKIFSCQNINTSNIVVNSPLNNYIKVLPFSKNGNSFSFSVLVFEDNSYPNDLYLKYYSNQTARLLNPNVLSQEFNLNLPSTEIYLNDATTLQDSGSTPLGFRLQNEIIIGENLFTMLDATIDITTGKTRLTALNF